MSPGFLYCCVATLEVSYKFLSMIRQLFFSLIRNTTGFPFLDNCIFLPDGARVVQCEDVTGSMFVQGHNVEPQTVVGWGRRSKAEALPKPLDSIYYDPTNINVRAGCEEPKTPLKETLNPPRLRCEWAGWEGALNVGAHHATRPAWWCARNIGKP